ncbi:hypothetical protein JK635_11240 [Neobacillus sp. YIM B02564]|uniref:Aminotransferase class V-fold PLP-dependent enzyme n=1 Tax=Neobacillus paridis TaxID=2803862 RepID=A0ABS1TPX5_9BACI|nr:hypothetical protein [Neobacillus paridis]MBL4952784.1 hypothetical protein [Neobacillus paridis]
MNLSGTRSLFPILSSHIHLASCSQGAIAKPVSTAIDEYHKSLVLNGSNWVAALERAGQARAIFAELIGAEKEEIAILCSVSDVFSSIVSSFSDHQNRKEIVFTDSDFPTIGHILYAQEKYKNHLSIIRSSSNGIPLEEYENKVTEKTLLTSLVSFYTKNASKTEKILKEKKIIVSARKDVIRIAPHFYNTKDEIQNALDELSLVVNSD